MQHHVLLYCTQVVHIILNVPQGLDVISSYSIYGEERCHDHLTAMTQQGKRLKCIYLANYICITKY